MEKRAIIALALSLAVLVSYQVIIAKIYPPKPSNTAKNEIVAGKIAELPKQPREENQAVIPTEIPAVFANETEVVFQNKPYKIIFTDIGAGIKSITLNKNPKDGLNIPYDIFSTKDPADSLCLFLPDKYGALLNNAKYEAKTTADSVTFSHSFNDGVILEKRFNFHNSLYLIELELIWKNVRSGGIVKKYSFVSGVHLPASLADEKFLEISANSNGKLARYKKRSKPFEITNSGDTNWVMLKNRYFAIIVKAFMPVAGYFVRQDQHGIVFSGLTAPEFNIPSNIEYSQKFGLYIGPADLSLVKAANIGIEGALSYGVFGSISQLLISGLKLFHRISGNWGVAILLLALLINVALLPLTKKSYKSIQDMQLLQPKIEKIRQELKSNPQKLQKEIMELYRKHKVNPMGGCLPLILQMPIFIALYQGLMNSIDLRGAGFLWVKDLSVPENIRIPFTLPLIGNTVNILPVLMLVAMFFQQRLSNKVVAMTQTDEQRQQQKIMSVMMTLMFGFIFWSFPSGLVLYWLVNTVIMTVYQAVLTKAPRSHETHE